MNTIVEIAALVLLNAVLVSCGKGDGEVQRARVEREMKSWLSAELHDFHLAATDLQRAAPVTPGRGWDEREDGAAIANIKSGLGAGSRSVRARRGSDCSAVPRVGYSD